MKSAFYTEVLQAIRSEGLSGQQLSQLKLRLCRKYRLKTVPTDIDVMLHASDAELKDVKIVTKPTRTISGVAVVALMSAPLSCPHGRCTFCPGGPGSVFGDVPQSYTGKEPSTMRGIRAGYDPYLITFNRLEQYVATGHNFGKVEVIVQGGTFPSYDASYQEYFVGFAFKALNDFSEMFASGGMLNLAAFKQFFELPGDIRDAERSLRIRQKILAIKGSMDLLHEQQRNELAGSRMVALCIETKPDFSKEEQITQMLRLGTTRVELGVQTLSDDILAATNRGHAMSDTLEAVQLLKDSFLKVGFHMMPGLPGSSRDMDIEEFRQLFEEPALRPDSLKIYPCLVMPGTQLYEDWKAGLFSPLSTRDAADIIAEGKRFVPEYCRLMRVQRDIPTFATSAGVDRTNLRQYVERLCAERNIACRCIRCRESKARKIGLDSLAFRKLEYESSGGNEVFISAETDDSLLGFCRLRIPFKPFRPEITPGCAGIRELHVFGPAASLASKGIVQHRGIGRALVAEAESVAVERFGAEKLLVISGVGAREYYRKLGYEREGAYMAKEL
ncbi:tRNA uridine(34) 5-carboxymethylaminomethyl modification radical SAM/GNAT enzyme Elp3 [Candidatus Woesearchaeota archaeon]|nr:tRNA uridine(34) 5-carboxymethylaminomethyl modification radical SAM/GNAT enzyme Elp3 [Candidatus Woesearchaeota archaeon]